MTDMSKSEVVAALKDITQGIENRLSFPGQLSKMDQTFMAAIKDNIETILPSIGSEDFK